MQPSRVSRPIYFLVPFWGRRYREYFVELSLPTLLAPNNFPLLRGEDGHRLIIATTPEDRRAIEHLPILDRLRSVVALEWIEVPEPAQPAAEDSDAVEKYRCSLWRATRYQRALVEVAYRDRAYGSLLFPDVLYSDGMVASLLGHAQAGRQLVLCPALRQTEEAVIQELRARRLLSPEVPLSATGQALTLPPRTLADLAVRHLHPEMWPFEEGNPGQPPCPPHRYWRLPRGNGILLYSCYWVPALMDHSAVAPDHTECLEQYIFEQIYVSRNFTGAKRIHLVRDSDEFIMCSLTPEGVNWGAPPRAVGRPSTKWVREFKLLLSFRETMWKYAGEPRDGLRRDFFGLYNCWHAEELDDATRRWARRIDRLMQHAAGDYFQAAGASSAEDGFPRRYSRDLRYLPIDLAVAGGRLREFLRPFYARRWELARKIGGLLRGDPATVRWLVERIRLRWRQLVGHTV